MASHGAPSRSIAAIADPSATALELPTPRKRNAQDMSVAAFPGCIVRPAQAREVVLDVEHRPLAAHFQQRALEPGEIALAPRRCGNAQAAAVEVDQPTLAGGVEQDVVRVEVGVVEAGTMEARDHPAGFLPRRIAAGDGRALGE